MRRFVSVISAAFILSVAYAVQPASGETKPDEITVYHAEGKNRVHVKACKRLTGDLAGYKTMTLAEAEAKGLPLCSRCPVGEGVKAGGAAPANKAPAVAGVKYDPSTMVYCDALWMRVHEESCPMLFLKDMKKTMTLEEADKAGWRIGESGQSGRDNCCFLGYRRKHPVKEIPEDSLGIVQSMKSGKIKFHLAGCHRFQVSRDNKAMTKTEAMALPGAYMCEHCTERGPSVTSVNAEGLAKMPVSKEFVPPADWTPKPLPVDTMPPKNEMDILVEEALCKGREVADTPYIDSLAMLEEFMGRRFFFGYPDAYKVYRATGDKRLLDELLESARYYHNLCVKYPSVAKLKARDPEHMNYLFSMAAWSRITLQLARKYPGKVSKEELAEAETFLTDIVSVLKPTWEGDEDLDPEMGIPKKLADDFRSRAFNRAMNGIGTLSMTAVALEDLQAIKKTSAYQPTIDRYRKGVEEKIKHWKKIGCLFTEADGKKYFYYPYAAGDIGKVVDGFKLFGSEDQGHFQYSVQGALLIYDAVPELGLDDDFMTAIANSVYHNSMTKKHGSIQCPSADKKSPMSRHPYGATRTGLYALEAFKDGIVDGQCCTLDAAKKAQANSDYARRVETVYGHYIKSLRKDRSLIYLGDKK